jgi:hypothetical protein
MESTAIERAEAVVTSSEPCLPVMVGAWDPLKGPDHLAEIQEVARASCGGAR